MTASIYHLYKDMYDRRRGLSAAGANIDKSHVWHDGIVASSGNRGVFPDVILKTNTDGGDFSGGEMIEIKESRSYVIPSFNSTLPAGAKKIADVAPRSSRIYQQLKKHDNNDPYHLPEREVYYLLRGSSKEGKMKICLTHGSFFATLPANENIRQILRDIFDEALDDNGVSQDKAHNSAKEKLLSLDWKQSHFNKTRHAENSSIKLRMRIMAEVNKNANILDGSQYPVIGDNTLNIAIPLFGRGNVRQKIIANMQKAFAADNLPGDIEIICLEHFLGHQFLVFQAPLE